MCCTRPKIFSGRETIGKTYVHAKQGALDSNQGSLAGQSIQVTPEHYLQADQFALCSTRGGQLSLSGQLKEYLGCQPSRTYVSSSDVC